MALLALQIVGALLLLDCLVQAGFARLLVTHFERKPRLRARSWPRRRRSEGFTSQTGDGVLLHGSIVRSELSPRGVVLFCHEFGGDRWSFEGHCAQAIHSGNDLVTFDFRNHGESDVEGRYDSSHWLTRREVTDVQTIIDWIRSRPEWRGLPLTLMGVSRGANAALAAAASRDVEGVVAVGAFSTLDLAFDHVLAGIQRSVPILLSIPHWHIRSTMRLAILWSGWRKGVRFVGLERVARRLNGARVLFIAGSDDSHVPASFQRALARRLRTPHFWTVPGGRHNLEREASPAEFDRRLAQFLGSIHRESGRSGGRELLPAVECPLRRAA